MVKKFLLSLAFLLVASPVWANIIQLNPTSTLLDSSNTNTNYSSTGTVSLVGNDAFIMRSPLSIPGGQSIVYARLYVWSNRAFSQGINVYRMLRDFTTSQATWNVYSTGNNWGSPGATNTSTDYTTTGSTSYSAQSGTYYEVDVTPQLTAAVAGASGVLDLMLRSGSANTGIGNATNPPYIIINTQVSGTPNNWYVRDDGASTFGTSSTTCNATVATGFTGSNGPNCALNNPQPLILGQGLNPAIIIGGDVINIDGDSHTSYTFVAPSGVVTRPAVGDTYSNNGITYTVTVTFPAGLTGGTITMSSTGAPTSSGTLTRVTGSGDSTITFSSEGAAQAMYKITASLVMPMGLSITQPTRLIGTGSHYAQLWQNNVYILIDTAVTPNYQDYENLDLTSHDSCIQGGPIGPGSPIANEVNQDGYFYVCNVGGSSSKYGGTGMQWGGTGLTLENVLIHGFANGMNNAVASGPIGNVTLTNVKVFGNSSQGALFGNSQTPGNVTSGTITEVNSEVQWSGCGQRYPMPDATDLFNNVSSAGFSKSLDNEANFYNCYGQQQNGYGDGYGWGNTGSSNAGNWTMIGSSNSFNSQDNVDTLHGLGTGTFIVARNRFEGGAGQELKLNANTIYVENNLINADCGRWLSAPESSTTQGYNNQEYLYIVSGITTWPIVAGNSGASTYSVNGVSYNVTSDTGSGTSGYVQMVGYVYPAVPPSSGTMTLVSGTGDATITYTSVTPENVGFSPGDICRAGGDAMVFPMGPGHTINMYNNTINNNAIGIEPGTGSNCDATTVINIYNNIMNCGGSTPFNPAFNGGNAQLATYLYFDGYSGNGGGPCGGPPANGGAITLNVGNNIVYNCKNSNSFCSTASEDQCQVDPGYNSTYRTGTVSINNGSPTLTGAGTTWTSSMIGEAVGFGTTSQAAVTTWYIIQSVNSTTSITLTQNYSGSNLSGSSYVIAIPMGTPTSPVNTYYHGTAMAVWLNLASTSAARNAGLSGLTFQAGTNDFNNYPQHTPNPDVGGLAYGSSYQGYVANGGACTSNQNCVSNFCISNTCSACLTNGTTTPAAQDCCSGLSEAGSCVACLTNGTSSSSAGSCCSGFLSGGMCVQYICGDGIVTTPPEACDTLGPQLAGNTCQNNGYSYGILGCTAGCLSLNTSGCTNTFNGPTVVQKAKYSSGSGYTTTIPLVLGSSPTAGNLMVAYVSYSQYSTTRTITPPSGWTLLDTYTQTPESMNTYYRVVQPGDGTTYTFTISVGNDYGSGVIYEITNENNITPFNGHSATGSASSSSVSTATLTPSVSNTLALTGITTDNASVSGLAVTNLAPGFVLDESALPSYHATFASSFNVTTGVTPVVNTFTFNGGTNNSSQEILLINPSTGCSSNGQSCSTGATCCSALCQGSLCVSCLANGGTCSTGTQCCTGYCGAGSTCSNIPPFSGSKNMSGNYTVKGMCIIK